MQKKAQKTLQTINIEANVLVVVLPKPKFENLQITFIGLNYLMFF
jgi:hypothetical protein